MKKLYVAFSTILIISGCSSLFGPEYSKPKINKSSDWNSGRSNNKDLAIKVANTPWWHKFNDKDLNKIVEQSLENNNNIQIAIGNIMQADAQLEKANMSWVPTIKLGANAFNGQTNNQNITPLNPALSAFTPANSMAFNGSMFSITPSYSLNIFQMIKNQDIAKLNLKMQQASKNAVRLSVISQAVNGYFSLLALKKQLAIQNQIIKDIEDMKEYTQIKIANGASNDIALKQINQSLYDIQAQIPQIKDAIVQTQNALQLLMNKNPNAIITQNDFDDIKINNNIPVDVPSVVLENRPDVILAEHALEISNAKIADAKSAFFPSIMLTAPTGKSTFELSNLFAGNLDFWNAQILATMPILNLSAYADVKHSKAAYYTSYYNYVQTVKSAFSQVDNSLSRNEAMGDIYKYQKQILKSIEDMYKFNKIQYDEGLISYADTLNTKLKLNSAKSNLVQAKLNQLNSTILLYQALGAGYNFNNTESAIKFGDSHDI